MVNPKVCEDILFTFATILLIVAALMAACISLILPRKSVQRTRTLNEINDTDFDPTFNKSAWLNSLKGDKELVEDPKIIVSISIFDGETKNTKFMCTGTAIDKDKVLTVQTCQLLDGRNISWSMMTVRSQSKYFSHGGITHKITKTHPCNKEGLEDIIVLIVDPPFSNSVIKENYLQTVFGGVIPKDNGGFILSGFGGDFVATDDVQCNDTIFIEKQTFTNTTPLCSEYIENCRWTQTIIDTDLHLKCSIKVRVSRDKTISAKNSYVGGNGRPYYQDLLNNGKPFYTIFGIQVNPIMSAASPDRDVIYLHKNFTDWIKTEFGIIKPNQVNDHIFSDGKKLSHFYHTTTLSIFLRNWYRYYENEFYGMPLKNMWYVFENGDFTNDPIEMPLPPHACDDQSVSKFKQRKMVDVGVEVDMFDPDYDLQFGLFNISEHIHNNSLTDDYDLTYEDVIDPSIPRYESTLMNDGSINLLNETSNINDYNRLQFDTSQAVGDKLSTDDDLFENNVSRSATDQE